MVYSINNLENKKRCVDDNNINNETEMVGILNVVNHHDKALCFHKQLTR